MPFYLSREEKARREGWCQAGQQGLGCSDLREKGHLAE